MASVAVTATTLERIRGVASDRERLSDAALLTATSGDPESFAAFYRRYERAVLAYVRRRVRDAEAAADLTAEIFAHVLAHAAAFDEERAGGSSAAPWLFTIAHNTVLTSLRRGRVADAARRHLRMTTPLTLHDEALDRIDELLSADGQVLKMLDELPESQRTAIRAHVLDDRRYGAIASELRCSQYVVRKRVSRGLSALRARLEEGS